MLRLCAERDLVLPPAMANLLGQCNGMPCGDWDPQTLVRWLPIDEWFVLSVDPSWRCAQSRGAWAFADYLIGSHFFAIQSAKGENGGRVFLVDGAIEELVAESFESFVRLYLAGDFERLNCTGDEDYVPPSGNAESE